METTPSTGVSSAMMVTPYQETAVQRIAKLKLASVATFSLLILQIPILGAFTLQPYLSVRFGFESLREITL